MTDALDKINRHVRRHQTGRLSAGLTPSLYWNVNVSVPRIRKRNLDDAFEDFSSVFFSSYVFRCCTEAHHRV